MAIALTGAVITRQDGRTMSYRKRCESCGAIQPGETTTGIIKGTSSALNSSFNCYKCRTRQEIKIQGEADEPPRVETKAADRQFSAAPIERVAVKDRPSSEIDSTNTSTASDPGTPIDPAGALAVAVLALLGYGCYWLYTFDWGGLWLNGLEKVSRVGYTTKQQYDLFKEKGGLKNASQQSWDGFNVLEAEWRFSGDELTVVDMTIGNGNGFKEPSFETLKTSLSAICPANWDIKVYNDSERYSFGKGNGGHAKDGKNIGCTMSKVEAGLKGAFPAEALYAIQLYTYPRPVASQR